MGTTEAGGLDIARIRKDFPLIDGLNLAYLDNSATSQKPNCVIDAEADYYRHYNANPMRGLYEISMEATDAYERARELTAELVGAAGSEEIIFTRNASESLNVAAASLGTFLKEGDEIIISVEEHHSNMLPWRMAAKKNGAVIKYLYPTPDGELKAEALEELLSERTKIVALTHMSNVYGYLNDLKALAAAAHKVGAWFVADGSQSIPHVPVNVYDLGVDLMAFSAHKMLGPMGVGVLWGRKELLEKMPPVLTGGEMITKVTLDDCTYAPLPHKFEAGTVNAGGVIAFAEAIRYADRIGRDRIAAREEYLTCLAVDGMKKIPGVDLIGSPDGADHHGVITFRIRDVHPHDAAAIFDASDIAIRAGHHCAQPLHQYLNIPSTIRASLMFYNTEEEITRFLDTLSTIRERMGCPPLSTEE